MNYDIWLYIGIIGGVISIGVALYLFFWVRKQDPGSARAQEVAKWIKDGAAAYLKNSYTALGILAFYSFSHHCIGFQPHKKWRHT